MMRLQYRSSLWLFPAFFLFLLFFLNAPCFAEGKIGIFGVYTTVDGSSKLNENVVGSVFLPPQADLVRFYRRAGKKVYLTLSVFGGSAAWKMYPDSRPVIANGQLLDKKIAGVCPAHPGWRKHQLDTLRTWCNTFKGDEQISGVWLDFIRYPGRWEEPDPHLPDTCWCERCLELFFKETGITLPVECTTTAEKSSWVKQHHRLEWVKWKKNQITSFVRDAQAIVKEVDRKLKLGVFFVPWRLSDYNGAVTFELGQDIRDFAPYIDIASPMVYHRMVGQSVDWIGDITRYFTHAFSGSVQPIIQAENVPANEFSEVVQAVAGNGADGLLVFKYNKITDKQWDAFLHFTPPSNLISNPELFPEGNKKEKPEQWQKSDKGTVHDSIFHYTPPKDGQPGIIGITGGRDRQGQWRTRLPFCKPGAQYRFEGEFFREKRQGPDDYPKILLWGEQVVFNTHRMTGQFQPLHATLTCPENLEKDESQFVFFNTSPGAQFQMRNPRLVKTQKDKVHLQKPPQNRFFPIGAYGANSNTLKQMKQSGLNCAVLWLNKENIQACSSAGMHCTYMVPRDPEELVTLLDRLEGKLPHHDFSFYVNDEPGIHSFPTDTSADIQRILKQHYPDIFTNMAVVRPQVIPDYQEGADYFMMDQYPVPNMPMTWLSDSLDQAAGYVGRHRLQAIIQAFGGGRYQKSGWPRLPNFEEMNCLAFLAVIHGARGLYFYTYPVITGKEKGKKDFEAVLGRLNSIRSWLEQENQEEPVTVTMTSNNKFDPQGRAAVHCTRKIQYNTQMLICTNTIRTFVEAAVHTPDKPSTAWLDYFNFSTGPYYSTEGKLYSSFAPLEVKVFLESNE